MLGDRQWGCRLEKVGPPTSTGQIKGTRYTNIIPLKFADVFDLPDQAEIQPKVHATTVPDLKVIFAQQGSERDSDEETASRKKTQSNISLTSSLSWIVSSLWTVVI